MKKKSLLMILSGIMSVALLGAVKLSASVSASAQTPSVSSVENTNHEIVGASIRLPNSQESSTSIRFLYRIDKTLVADGLYNMGILVAPEYALSSDTLDLDYVSGGNVGSQVEYVYNGNRTDNEYHYGNKKDTLDKVCAESEADSVCMRIYCYNIPQSHLHQNIVCVGYYQKSAESEVVYTEPKIRNLAWVGGEALRAGEVSGEYAETLQKFLEGATDHVRVEQNIQKNYTVDSNGYLQSAGSCEASCSECGITLPAEYDMQKDLYALGNYGNFTSDFRKVDSNNWLGGLIAGTGTVTAGATDGEYTVKGGTYALWMPNTAMTGDYEFQVTMRRDIYNEQDIMSNRGIAITNGDLMLSFNMRPWGEFCVNISENNVCQDERWFRDSTADKTSGINYSVWQTWKIRRIGGSIELWRGDNKLVTVTQDDIVYGDNVIYYESWGNDIFTSGKSNMKAFFESEKAHVIGFSSVDPTESTDTYKIFGLRSLQKEIGEVEWLWTDTFIPSRKDTLIVSEE